MNTILLCVSNWVIKKSWENRKATNDQLTKIQKVKGNKTFLFSDFVLFVIGDRSHHEEQTGLELTLKPRQALSTPYFYFSLQSLVNLGVSHYS